jgi:hypothetical protein
VRIAHFWPAYKAQVGVEAAYGLMRDVHWAWRKGHTLEPFYRDGSCIARSRDWALAQAIEGKFDLLVMQDADCAMQGSAVEQLSATMVEHDAAAVGAVFWLRDKERTNCDPAREGEVYEGEVGTGLMLVNVAKVFDLPPKRFQNIRSEDGTLLDVGEDIFFCQLLKKHGLKVVVDFTRITDHGGLVMKPRRRLH